MLTDNLRSGGKWMITPAAFSTLMADVALLKSGAKVSVAKALQSERPEFQIEGASAPTDAEGGNIAVINVTGKVVKGSSPDEEDSLGLCNIDLVSQALDESNTDPTVSSILIFFSSPGGESTGIEELGRKIAASQKIVYGWTETQAASAAYWLMSQCSILGMTPSAQVGSIGVYAVIDDITGAMEQAGIAKNAIHSGKYKLIGADFRKLSDEERDILQKDVNASHDRFKNAILAKRQVAPEYMEGLSYEGADALAANLVDVVVDDVNQFLSAADTSNMKNLFKKIGKPAVKTEVAPAVVKSAEAVKKDEKDLPGVPGAKEDELPVKKEDELPVKKEDELPVKKEEEEGNYDGGYHATCPMCKHIWKLEEKHLSKMVPVKSEEDEKPAAEPEKHVEEVDPKEDVEDVTDEKPAPQPTEKSEPEVPAEKNDEKKAKRMAALMNAEGWQKAVGTHIPKQTNAFLDASAKFAAGVVTKMQKKV